MIRKHRKLGQPKSSQDGGFTLMEILLSVGLMVLLMAAIFSALDLYWKYSTAGRDQVKEAQLARAILQKISTDLRSVVFRPEEPVESEDEDEDTDLSDETMELAVVDPSLAFTGQSTGLSGTATELIVHASRPSRRLDYGTLGQTESLADQTSDMRSIWYFLAQNGGDGLSGTVASRQSGTADNHGIHGLARLEGDRLLISTADVGSDFDMLADNTELLAEEVSYVQFQYIDSGEVFEEWDSSVYNRLPQAVEIIIGFRDLNEDEPALHTQSAPQIPEQTWRLVVALPLADRTPAEEEF